MAAGAEILGDAYVNVLAETGQLQSGFNQAISISETAVGNIGKAVAIGIGSAIAAALGTGIASVWMWAEEEKSVVDLTSSLEMLGADLDTLMPKYERTAAEIQGLTTIADTQTRKMMALAAALGAPVDRLDELAVAAAGLAARINMDPLTAMSYLVRGLLSGSFSILGRYGLVVDTTKTKAEQFAQVLEFSNKGFEKQIKMADSLTGRLTQLKNLFGDFMEAVGQKIAEKFNLKGIVDEVSKRLWQVIAVLNTALDRIKPASIDLSKIGDSFIEITKRISIALALIPELGRQLRDIVTNLFSKDLWLSTLLPAFRAVADFFLESLVLGLSSLRSIFEFLGTAIGQGLEKWMLHSGVALLQDPILKKFGMKRGMFQDVSPDQINLIDKLLARKTKITWDNIPSLVTDELKSAKGMISKRFQETIDQLMDAISSIGKVDLSEERSKVIKIIEGIFAQYEPTGRPGGGGSPFDVADLSKKKESAATFAILSFSDFWRKSQEAAFKATEEKTQTKLLESIANNTELLAKKKPSVIEEPLYGIA